MITAPNEFPRDMEVSDPGSGSHQFAGGCAHAFKLRVDGSSPPRFGKNCSTSSPRTAATSALRSARLSSRSPCTGFLNRRTTRSSGMSVIRPTRTSC